MVEQIYTNATEKGFESVAVLTGFESGAQALAVCNGLKKDGATVRNAYASDGEYFVDVLFNEKFIELFKIDAIAKKGARGDCVFRRLEAYGDKLYYFDGKDFFIDFEYIGE